MWELLVGGVSGQEELDIIPTMSLLYGVPDALVASELKHLRLSAGSLLSVLQAALLLRSNDIIETQCMVAAVWITTRRILRGAWEPSQLVVTRPR
jgi:hypothetical protein